MSQQSQVRDKIVSEDYADLLIKYNGDLSVLNAFPNSSYQIINNLFAAVYVPVNLINDQAIKTFGYSAMPTCFGIVSEASLEASGIVKIRSVPNFDLRGSGVLIGIIDTGIDYTNPVFQYADKTTRIASLWDQTIQTGTPPNGIVYGTEYSREQINNALKSNTPLNVVPSKDESGHGTMVAGIAGGNEVPDNNFYGVAPECEFIIVKLKTAKKYLREFFFIPENAVCFEEIDIMFGLNYLLNVSTDLKKPIVICICLGSSQGAHDGSLPISYYLSLISGRSGVVSVVPAGNEGNERRHYHGTINATSGFDTVELNIAENEPGFTMEIWGLPPSILSIDITTPSGEYVPKITAARDEQRTVTFIFEKTILYIDYQMVEQQSGDQLILVRFQGPSQGIWRFKVYERTGLSMGFDIWLPMENFISNDTYFIRSDPYTTLLTMANAEVPISVTAYNYENDSLFVNASRGYTRVQKIKPDIAAPGVNVTGPTLDQKFTSFTGTSVSAAHTAGVAAMILEWGTVRGSLPRMSTVEVRKLMIRGARRDVNLTYPNRDWGYGILDIYNVFNSLRTSNVV